MSNANTDPARMAQLRREAARCGPTHHEACACRELAHAEAEAEVGRLRGLVQREHDARLEIHREAETLLRERDAAEARNAALREIVQSLADGIATYDTVLKARALLAAQQTVEAEEGVDDGSLR